MNVLLIFFAIPLATIILSAILETFINCPIKVAGIFFSVFIVVAFALGGTAELIVAAIIYTIISFITAVIIKYLNSRQCSRNNCSSRNVIENWYDNQNFNRRINEISSIEIERLNQENSLPIDTAVTLNNSNTRNMCRRCR